MDRTFRSDGVDCFLAGSAGQALGREGGACAKHSVRAGNCSSRVRRRLCVDRTINPLAGRMTLRRDIRGGERGVSCTVYPPRNLGAPVTLLPCPGRGPDWRWESAASVDRNPEAVRGGNRAKASGRNPRRQPRPGKKPVTIALLQPAQVKRVRNSELKQCPPSGILPSEPWRSRTS